MTCFRFFSSRAHKFFLFNKKKNYLGSSRIHDVSHSIMIPREWFLEKRNGTTYPHPWLSNGCSIHPVLYIMPTWNICCWKDQSLNNLTKSPSFSQSPSRVEIIQHGYICGARRKKWGFFWCLSHAIRWHFARIWWVVMGIYFFLQFSKGERQRASHSSL